MYIVFITPWTHYIYALDKSNHAVTCLEIPTDCKSVQIYSSIMNIRKRYDLEPADALKIIREGYLTIGV